MVKLCTLPGFIHVVAYISITNDTISISGDLTADDVSSLHSPEHLVRNEINALVGCLVKSDIDWAMPTQKMFAKMHHRAINLLSAYQKLIESNAIDAEKMKIGNITTCSPNEAVTFEECRFDIFYAPESSFHFQFRDMALERYSGDTDWMLKNRMFSPDDARAICKAISDYQFRILNTRPNDSETHHFDLSRALAFHRLDMDEITANSGVGRQRVDSFLSAFTWDTTCKHKKYRRLDDKNHITVRPIFRATDGEHYLFQNYSLTESTYDSPFRWMDKDDEYKSTAITNRGRFPETFLARKLHKVFGSDCVFQNVYIHTGKSTRHEIDCLVVFGDCALFFQMKSTVLNSKARSGNINDLKEPFDRGVQKAYRQSVNCFREMQKRGVRFTSDEAGKNEMDLSCLGHVKHVFPVCVLADHYPALTTQVKAFLKTDLDTKIEPPFVCDLFLMDILNRHAFIPLVFH